MSVIAEHYSPSCIVVLEHNANNDSFEKLFKFIDSVINPTEEIFDMIKKRNEELDRMFKKLKKRKN